MMWGRVSFCFLCISLVHCSSKLKSVDQSLTTKKGSDGGNTVKRQVEVTTDVALNHADAAVAKVAAAVPAIRVSDTCTVKVCSKQDGYSIDEPMIPNWYHQYLTTNNVVYFRRLSYYTDVPTWQDVTYCVTMTQKNDKTHVTSWFNKVPAGRLYWFVVGYAEYDDELKEQISKNKDACHGEIKMRWKYILDIFHTGDDFTKMPNENSIDDLKPSNQASIVNSRSGSWKFTGKALVHMARWHARKAFWVIDATTVEFVDLPSTFSDDYEAPFNYAGFNHDGYFFLYPPLVSIEEVLNGKYSKNPQQKYSFWNSAATDFKKLSHQKEQFFDENNKASKNNEKSGAVFVNYYFSDSQSYLETRQLFEKVAYDDYKLNLVIVACGLFPKTMPLPKNCDVKGESEGV